MHPMKIIMRKVQVEGNNSEPMLQYKYLTIASGATPIGSTGRAPDENPGKKKNYRREKILAKDSM